MKRVPLRVISLDFELLAQIDDYESLQFTRRFYRAGAFELQIALGKNHTDQLQIDRVIMLGNQQHKTGFIASREISLGENGEEIVVVRGPTLGGVLDFRTIITDSYDRVSGPAETVLKYYVNRHIVSGIYPERAVPFFAVAPDLGRGVSTPWQSRYEPLSEVVESIAKWCDIGWYVRLDFAVQKWIFDVIVGRDLTASQSLLPPVIFSPEFGNVLSQQYTESNQNYRSVAYAGGKGEDEDRLIQVVGSASGFARREIFIDASSAEDAIELADIGAQKLAGYKRIKTLEGEIVDTNGFMYEADWDLGDIVTIRSKKWSVSLDDRITAVKEIYEQNSKIEVQFGEDLPNITREVRALKTQAKRRT